MRDGSCRAVAAEVAFREEFDLFVVGVASDGTGGAYSARGGTRQTEVDRLSNGPHAECAARELVRQDKRGLAK